MRTVVCQALIIILISVLSGCNVGDLAKIVTYDFKKENKELTPTPIVDKTVKDVDLAKIILKPKHLTMKVKRDPFEPLLIKTEDNLIVTENATLDVDVIKDIHFLGLVNMGDQPFALMSLEDVSKVYKVGDMIRTLVIAEIHSDHVVLQIDGKTIKLNRGDK